MRLLPLKRAFDLGYLFGFAVGYFRGLSWSRNAQLIFDYRDVGDYKLVGLRVGAQKRVIKAVENDVESDPSTSSV